jgi:hypothetical protein
MNEPQKEETERSEPEPGCVIELPNDEKTIVSKEDFDYLQRWNWSSNGRYAVACIRGKSVLMGRVIAERMGLNTAFQIKYRDGDPHNNRRSNILQSSKPMTPKRPRKRGNNHEQAA